MLVRAWVDKYSLSILYRSRRRRRSLSRCYPPPFLRAERLDRKTVSRQIRRFLSLSRTDCLTSICPRCVSVCAYFSFFTILSSFFLFVFFPFFSYSSFIFSFVFAFIWRRCGWVMGAGFLPSPISPSHQTVHTRPHRKFKNKFKSFFSRMYKKIDIWSRRKMGKPSGPEASSLSLSNFFFSLLLVPPPGSCVQTVLFHFFCLSLSTSFHQILLISSFIRQALPFKWCAMDCALIHQKWQGNGNQVKTHLYFILDFLG